MISDMKAELDEVIARLEKSLKDEQDNVTSRSDEKLKSLEILVNETKTDLKSVSDVSSRYIPFMQTVETLADKVNNIEDKQPKMKSEMLHDLLELRKYLDDRLAVIEEDYKNENKSLRNNGDKVLEQIEAFKNKHNTDREQMS
jgi:hypothetical protein